MIRRMERARTPGPGQTVTVTIPRHFHGPPDSGNGGYTCGLTALAMTEGPAEVTLRRPPPLDRPLRIEPSGQGVALVDGDEVVAQARPAQPDVELPEPVGWDEAQRAARAFDVDAYAGEHAFPTCYTCGPGRAEGEGLRLFPAPTGRPDRVVAWPWVPDASLADATGRVAGATMWAALDCPSGLAWITGRQPSGPAVLGRMTVALHRRPRPGEHLVVAGWPIAAEGRKLLAGAAVWSADGEVLAVNAATWIRLSDDQQAAFRVAGSS